MRKHFLLLFLMALLPLAGWATDYNVTVYAKNKTLFFGQANPTTAADKLTMFDVQGTSNNDLLTAIAGVISYSTERTSASAVSASGYSFTLTKDANYVTSGDDRYFITIPATDASAKFIVRKADISTDDAVITITGSKAIQANGEATPTITLTVGEETLEKDVDYEVAYTYNTVAEQNATITVTALAGSAKLEGGKQKTTQFEVGKRGIEDVVITLKSTFLPKFTGAAITITADDIQSITQDDAALASTEWAIDSYEDNIEAGTAKVIFKGAGSHDANSTKEVEFTIAPATNIGIVTFNTIDDLTYTGKKAEPVVTAYIELGNNTQYDANADYAITVADEFTLTTTNQDVTNTASVTVTGKGKNFATTASTALAYKILPFNLANANVQIENVEYNASAQEVAPVLTIGTGDNAITIPSTSYTLNYKDHNNVVKGGEGYDVTSIQDDIKVVATANDNTNYTGSTPAFNENNVITYNITPKAITIAAAEFTVGHGADLAVSVDLKTGSTLVGNDTWEMLTSDVDLTSTAKYNFYADDNGVQGNPLQNVPTDIGFYWYALKADALTSATAGNYDITPEAARFEITTAQIIARVKTKNDVVYGTNASNWDLEYVSGLGTNAAATATFNTIKANLNIQDANFAFVDQNLQVTPTTAAWLDVVDGNGYEVKYTGTQTYGNYQISVQNGYLKPVAKELNDQTNTTYDVAIQINGGNAITYAGAVPASTTAWTATYNNEDVTDQLAIEYDADFNVGERTALVTPKSGNKNFVANRVEVVQVNNVDTNVPHTDRPVAYNIGRANLIIKADDKLTWIYGSPNNDPLSFTATGLVGADAGINLADADVAEAHKFTGAVKVDIDGSDGVGTHTNGLVPSGITASVNYNITWQKGNLVVDYNTVTVKIKDQTIIYGEAPAAFELEVVGDNITDEQKASINQIINWTKATNYDAADMKDVDAYEINATDADAATATNYHVNEILPGSLTIQKRPVTFTAKSYVYVDENNDNRIAYGNLTAWLAALEVSANFIDVTSGSIADNATYNNGETITDLIASIAPKTTIIGFDNVLELTKATEGAAANYDITTVNGVLQLTDAGVGELVFNSADIDSKKITDFHGVVKNVKINFTPRNSQTINTNYGTWKAGFWNTLVLPFDISVADLSKALGYAIVNVIDPAGRSLDSNGNPVFKFKLTMKGGNGSAEVLKANKPFVVKLADDIKTVDGNNDPYYYDFGPQTIVAPQNADDLTLDAGFDCKFVGTYTTTGAGKDSEGAGKYWFLVGDYDTKWIYSSKSEWNIVPFAAYIDLSNMDPKKAREATFIMEEIDGSTTTIKSANIDDVKSLGAEGWYNLNGMKMNGAPAQKGVFIQNGKKVVIK